MPFIERRLGGIIRIETTLQEEQEALAAKMAEVMERAGVFRNEAGQQTRKFDAEAIRRERWRTTYIFGKRVDKTLIIDSIDHPRFPETFGASQGGMFDFGIDL